MGLCSQQYLCINENLNVSYNPPPLRKFQIKYLIDSNQIHLMGEFLAFLELVVSRRVHDNTTSPSFHCCYDEQVF